jgi:hypothetical protein
MAGTFLQAPVKVQADSFSAVAVDVDIAKTPMNLHTVELQLSAAATTSENATVKAVSGSNSRVLAEFDPSTTSETTITFDFGVGRGLASIETLAIDFANSDGLDIDVITAFMPY